MVQLISGERCLLGPAKGVLVLEIVTIAKKERIVLPILASRIFQGLWLLYLAFGGLDH